VRVHGGMVEVATNAPRSAPTDAPARPIGPYLRSHRVPHLPAADLLRTEMSDRSAPVPAASVDTIAICTGAWVAARRSRTERATHAPMSTAGSFLPVDRLGTARMIGTAVANPMTRPADAIVATHAASPTDPEVTR